MLRFAPSISNQLRDGTERCYGFLSDLFQSAEGDKVI